MQHATNTKLVRNRVRLAGILSIAGLAIALAGIGALYALGQENFIYAYPPVVIGFIISQVAQTQLRRWGPRGRQDGVLAQHIKGLDNRYTLVNFASVSLPDYLLIGPQGVLVLVTRPQRGTFACRGDRWTVESGGRGLLRWFGPQLGSPTVDAQAGTESVKRYLAKELADCEQPSVEAAIVFTHREARLRVDGCSYPVTTAKELRHHVRRLKSNLSQTQVDAVREALVPSGAQT